MQLALSNHSDVEISGMFPTLFAIFFVPTLKCRVPKENPFGPSILWQCDYLCNWQNTRGVSTNFCEGFHTKTVTCDCNPWTPHMANFLQVQNPVNITRGFDNCAKRSSKVSIQCFQFINFVFAKRAIGDLKTSKLEITMGLGTSFCPGNIMFAKSGLQKLFVLRLCGRPAGVCPEGIQ